METKEIPIQTLEIPTTIHIEVPVIFSRAEPSANQLDVKLTYHIPQPVIVDFPIPIQVIVRPTMTPEEIQDSVIQVTKRELARAVKKMKKGKK
jgi:hypothetical protein